MGFEARLGRKLCFVGPETKKLKEETRVNSGRYENDKSFSSNTNVDVYEYDNNILSDENVRGGLVQALSEVAEKKVISNHATVGIYYWKKGSDYVKYAEQMIHKGIRTNNEFYICPVFNEAIEDGKKIRVKHIDKMWGIGTPEDLNYFLDNHK